MASRRWDTNIILRRNWPFHIVSKMLEWVVVLGTVGQWSFSRKPLLGPFGDNTSFVPWGIIMPERSIQVRINCSEEGINWVSNNIHICHPVQTFFSGYQRPWCVLGKHSPHHYCTVDTKGDDCMNVWCLSQILKQDPDSDSGLFVHQHEEPRALYFAFFVFLHTSVVHIWCSVARWRHMFSFFADDIGTQRGFCLDWATA